jgi:transposase
MDPHRPGSGAGAAAAGHAAETTLDSYRVGALPILNRLLPRLRLEEFLRDFLPREDRRCRIATATGLVILVKNLLLSREPLSGLGEWAARSAPDLLGLSHEQLASLNDDRMGRCLDGLFRSDCPSLALAVATHAVREFDVELDELHNDSTTVTFHGAYTDAAVEKRRNGRSTAAITWGHNKDHRPDLKQLLSILTIARDGGVPVSFEVKSGNVTDDRTHRATWDLLCRLTGRPDFRSVADCKAATVETMAYIHQRRGGFLSVLPRTRAEDGAFRALVGRGQVGWRPISDKCTERGELVDRYSISDQPSVSAEGYRLIWYHSTRKAELDALARAQQVERALLEWAALRAKLGSRRTRSRQRAKVVEAVEAILQSRGVSEWIVAEIGERTEERSRQKGPGRPSAGTPYVREEVTRFELSDRIEYEHMAGAGLCDGIFPLITNETAMSDLDLLLSYKDQAIIEKRFEQLKTDFVVAPVYLKNVSRIQALLCIYFFVLLVEALLEREQRRAMEREGIERLPLYPEDRTCRRPSARRIIDIFAEVQRHRLVVAPEPPVELRTELTRLQRELLDLLGIPRSDYTC